MLEIEEMMYLCGESANFVTDHLKPYFPSFQVNSPSPQAQSNHAVPVNPSPVPDKVEVSPPPVFTVQSDPVFAKYFRMVKMVSCLNSGMKLSDSYLCHRLAFNFA